LHLNCPLCRQPYKEIVNSSQTKTTISEFFSQEQFQVTMTFAKSKHKSVVSQLTALHTNSRERLYRDRDIYITRIRNLTFCLQKEKEHTQALEEQLKQAKATLTQQKINFSIQKKALRDRVLTPFAEFLEIPVRRGGRTRNSSHLSRTRTPSSHIAVNISSDSD
jgi:hypothetical protein